MAHVDKFFKNLCQLPVPGRQAKPMAVVLGKCWGSVYSTVLVVATYVV